MTSPRGPSANGGCGSEGNAVRVTVPAEVTHVPTQDPHRRRKLCIAPL